MRKYLLLSLILGCSTPGAGHNAFLDGESGDDKEDTGFVTSLDAVEVEVDLEGDVAASSFAIERAPLEVGQFALTYLRKHDLVYIQSMAEDFAHGADKIEWKVDGKWTTMAASPDLDRSKLSHFRMRGVSAVVRHPGRLEVGKTWSPIVPKRPDRLFADVGTKCGTKEGAIDVEQDVYWYVWDPTKSGCAADTAPVTVTISKLITRGPSVYPEYDRLLADKRIDVLVIFGQGDHGALTDDDFVFDLIREFEGNLTDSGFAKENVDLGLRYTRTRRGVTAVIDIFTPHEFAGLDDFAHVDNFDKGVRDHEIIVYNGHSMLGASDFWARPSIYDGASASKYQIFLYNGCLGYEYYVNPILEGKGSWQNVDLVSNIVETPFAIMVEETASTLGKIIASAERGGTTSWQSLLNNMNKIAAEDSFYGASGARDNKFKP